jgi:hypothetical protein
VWNGVVDDEEEGGVVVLHYVGGKPWNTKEELEAIDWEERDCKDVAGRYGELFDVWKYIVREGGGGGGDREPRLVPKVPRAVEV